MEGISDVRKGLGENDNLAAISLASTLCVGAYILSIRY